jgi:hypothetical protein
MNMRDRLIALAGGTKFRRPGWQPNLYVFMCPETGHLKIWNCGTVHEYYEFHTYNDWQEIREPMVYTWYATVGELGVLDIEYDKLSNMKRILQLYPGWAHRKVRVQVTEILEETPSE